MFNYLEDFKQINDSRCYLFDKLCSIKMDGAYNSVVGYAYFERECLNYPHDWRDSSGDGCGYYKSNNWCTNSTMLRNKNDYYQFADDTYQLSAIESCCECGGGIDIMDNVAFSMDYNWIDFDDDVLCTWVDSRFTTQLLATANWDNIILYDMCMDFNDIECNVLIDAQFNSNHYAYSLY
eukprot:712151_1